MQLDSDAGRLRDIKAAGGVLVRIDNTEVWALFRNGYLETGVAPGVEGRQPYLACRSIDAASVVKDMAVEVGAEVYRVKRVEPDGLGMSRVLLKR